MPPLCHIYHYFLLPVYFQNCCCMLLALPLIQQFQAERFRCFRPLQQLNPTFLVTDKHYLGCEFSGSEICVHTVGSTCVLHCQCAHYNVCWLTSICVQGADCHKLQLIQGLTLIVRVAHCGYPPTSHHSKTAILRMQQYLCASLAFGFLYLKTIRM